MVGVHDIMNIYIHIISIYFNKTSEKIHEKESV